ncbi:DUF6894 family protein [Microvirga puerhi]|uniref:DUF6894 domain-containing protein n=1 Tax=Microvirga puerhi TaxID=2876078 RepID=A0ABS7VMJ5_9HYPH|nr:hypothetical protein [Microvirga puerhi]MBZ6076746.1 hypothetical protein [Microvirga puerhi]
MRCYFNLSNGDSFFADNDGVEISSLDEAHGEVLDAIRETFLDRDPHAVDLQGWALDVVDTTGRVLLSMSLEEAVEAPDFDRGMDDPFDFLH